MPGVRLASALGIAVVTAATTVVGGSLAITAAATAPSASRPSVTVREAIPESIDLDGVPTDVEASRDAVWVSTSLDGIVRIDPRTKARVASIRTGGSILALDRGFGALWAIDVFGDRLLRIDPLTNRVVKEVPVDPLPSGLALGDGLVWVASQLESTVAGIDPMTGEVVKLARFARGELWPGGLAVGPDGVWVITGAGNEVSLYDPESMRFRHRTRVPGARTIATAGRDTWVGLSGGRSLIRIRDSRILQAPASVPADGYGPSFAIGRHLWVGSGDAVAAIDRANGRVVARLRFPGLSIAALATAGDIWAVDAHRRTLVRLGPGDGRLAASAEGGDDA